MYFAEERKIIFQLSTDLMILQHSCGKHTFESSPGGDRASVYPNEVLRVAHAGPAAVMEIPPECCVSSNIHVTIASDVGENETNQRTSCKH